jgi:hypothetical protein
MLKSFQAFLADDWRRGAASIVADYQLVIVKLQLRSIIEITSLTTPQPTLSPAKLLTRALHLLP